ncbi:MAG: RNA-directed DNA polymerase [Sandaracinaceae bacterium]|nr:RNA-directed DNA polymerase [Sandaracinaceae bacterium]
MLARAKARSHFSAINIDVVVARALSAGERAEIAPWVEQLFRRGVLQGHAYTRTLVRAGDRVIWIYHPQDQAPEPVSPGSPAPSAAAASHAAPRPAAHAAGPLLDAGSLWKLSPDELRARALDVKPYLTAWIGRVDVIPPASDERTALIDRGLVLRGLLTEAQILEIHRVGDLWLEHSDAARLAQLRAYKKADDAILALRARDAELKAEKRKLAAERAQRRREEIARRKNEDIVFLGRGVSERLHDRRADVEKLERLGLPVLATPADLAKALGLRAPELRFLAFHAEATERPHYVQFDVPKRSGGTRRLSAPLPKLAAAQRWILDNVLCKVAPHDAAHGFVPGRSTLTNARPHLKKGVVVNLDLQDFFPSITFPRVRGVFASLGYSPAVATILALLTTEPPRRAVRYAERTLHVAVGSRGLPQGACTSPAISNLACRKLDRRLSGLAAKHGLTYTRYADDLTLSGPKDTHVARLLASLRHLIESESFRVNDKKGRVQRAGGQQTVTGVVVNDKPSVPRSERKRLRAILHQAKKTGLEKQNRAGVPSFEAHLRGKIAYVSMIDGTRGAELAKALDALD